MTEASERAKKPVLRDQEARDLITSSLKTNVMVLAGAGAGKTYALIERMVAAVRTGAARVDRMAAITFTRKAAGEMRGRFLLRLRKELDDAEGDGRRRIQEALRLIDQCFIGTIHSFCGRILRERPMEAGLSPEFSEIEDRDEAILRRRAWDRFVQERTAADDNRLYELEEHGITPEDLYAFFGRRCRYRDLPLKETATTKPELEGPVTEVRRFLNTVSQHIPTAPDSRDGAMETLRRARHFLDNHGIESDRDRAAFLKLFDGRLGVTQKHWDDREFAKRLQHELLPELQERVVGPALRDWRECAYGLVSRFVDDGVDYYDGLRQEQGVVTFQDLLLRTAAVLRDHPDVRTYFQRRFGTILVDEFQDTDPVQARIIMYLTATDARETDWLQVVPRPGSLFLVGDDKQSIYRFRRADVATFRQVRQRIEETGGKVLHLNTSFRSLGNLCRWISDAFPSVFETPSDPYQARFVPLHQSRPPGVDPHCVRRISISKVHRNRRNEIVEADASRIARYIAAAVRGETPENSDVPDGPLGAHASPGDFMILTRTSNRISEYARALEAQGVPFDVSGGSRLGESLELRALVSILETVFTPDNPLPFLAFLRGPLVGLADDELFDFSTAGGRFDYREALPQDLEPSLYGRLSDARKLLEQSEHALTTRPPAAALELILEWSGLLPYASVNPDGQASSRAGNLLRAVSLVQRHAGKGWHWGEIMHDLRDLVSDQDYSVEEMTLETGREDVVRIMNLHQAKGLQAKVVFLADPYDLSPYKWSPDVHVSRSGEKSYLSMTVEKPKGEYGKDVVAQPAGWDEDLAEEERFEAAEEVRLLYVAATRAQNLLVVSRYDGNTAKGPWHPLYRYLDNVPELADVDAAISDGSKQDTPDWQALREALTARFRQAQVPSYSVRTVSGSRISEDVSIEAREGRGREYGVVVHQLLEDAVHGRVPDSAGAYVQRVIREARLEPRLADDAVRALERFRASEIWQEVCQADQIFTEVPLARFASGDGGGDVLRGVIDLVYRLNGRWKIVDYKTDAAETEADLEHLESTYRVQVERYAALWQEITMQEVASSELWFVHGPRKDDQLTLFGAGN